MVINWSAFIWFRVTRHIYDFVEALRGMYSVAYRSVKKSSHGIAAAYCNWREHHWDRRAWYWADLCETYREKAYGL